MPCVCQDEDAESQEQLQQRVAALAAFQQLQQGSVSDAMAIASRYCPAVLEVRPCLLAAALLSALSVQHLILLSQGAMHERHDVRKSQQKPCTGSTEQSGPSAQATDDLKTLQHCYCTAAMSCI